MMRISAPAHELHAGDKIVIHGFRIDGRTGEEILEVTEIYDASDFDVKPFIPPAPRKMVRVGPNQAYLRLRKSRW